MAAAGYNLATGQGDLGDVLSIVGVAPIGKVGKIVGTAVTGFRASSEVIEAGAKIAKAESAIGKIGGSIKKGVADLQDLRPRPRFSKSEMADITAKLGEKPLGMVNAHLHHILSVNGRTGAERALVREGQAILKQVGIDALKGVENLAWAPNKGHTIAETRALVTALRGAEANGRARIEKILLQFGDRAANR